jgi:hypothetical protein
MRDVQRALIEWSLRKDGHDPHLHPHNPYIDISLRRKLRRAGKGKVVLSKHTPIVVSTPKVITPDEAESRIILPWRKK